jgi:hypothetical protein
MRQETTPALRAFAVRSTPSLEGNKTAPAFATCGNFPHSATHHLQRPIPTHARSARIIPLYGGVARSAGVVRAACYAKVVSAFDCVNYYRLY